MTQHSLPAYVYKENITEASLLQGDVIKVDGKFKDFFKDFYPAINHDESGKYVMILTQSCDLVKEKKRTPKLRHVNICLIRNLKSYLQRLIEEEVKPLCLEDKKILERDALDKLKEKLSKLLNNNEQKTHFFLPKKSPFVEDMVAIIPLSFSFRIEHYDLLLHNRVLGLKSDFQAKLGYVISQLYGRIGTIDLSDCGYDDKQTRNYINHLLSDLNLVQVPDRTFIEHLKTNQNNQDTSIEDIIKTFQIKKNEDAFKNIKNELLQNISHRLITLFGDKEKIEKLLSLDKKNLSQEIKQLLNQK